MFTICQSICKSLYPKLYYGSCTFTKFGWITWLWWLCWLLTRSLPPLPPYQIIGNLDILWYPIIVSHFVSFLGAEMRIQGNYLMLVNLTNIHDRHKVFQVAHESWDCTQPIWIIFQFCFILTDGEKRGKEMNCGNGSWKSLLSCNLTSCALNEKQK